MRYRAVISYDGTNYVGWQRQLNGLSVQEVLEKALTKTFGINTQATASGRTDAGVHAEGQVVHFDSDTSIPAEKIPFVINPELPDDISMLSCEIAADDFNARFNAKRKTYCYKLYISKHRRPMLEHTHARISIPIDLKKMRKAADLIEGEHDFKCFEASGSVVKSTVRTVYSIEIKSDGKVENGVLSEGTVEIYVTGNGFLYNMVRIMAGTLVYVGTEKLDPADVSQILESGDRTRAGKTLPPQGLHLISVMY